MEHINGVPPVFLIPKELMVLEELHSVINRPLYVIIPLEI